MVLWNTQAIFWGEEIRMNFASDGVVSKGCFQSQFHVQIYLTVSGQISLNVSDLRTRDEPFETHLAPDRTDINKFPLLFEGICRVPLVYISLQYWKYTDGTMSIFYLIWQIPTVITECIHLFFKLSHPIHISLTQSKLSYIQWKLRQKTWMAF